LGDGVYITLSDGNRGRAGALFAVSGAQTKKVSKIDEGDVLAIGKLDPVAAGDVLSTGASSPKAKAGPLARFPVYQLAIATKDRKDDVRLSGALTKLAEEDPGLAIHHDQDSHEIVLHGQGDSHLRIVLERLRKRFNVDVSTARPSTPYKETIRKSATQRGRHKKQTGGHGQFGDCKIRVEPLSRGAEFEFVDDIFGGAIPRQFVPAVEKGIQESRMRGYLAGYPVVDFRVTVFDGSYHDVDSNELSFKMAGSLAFKDAMTRAKPTILEPVMNVEIYAPSDFAGDLMGDLNGRRGRIGGMDTRGSMTIIKAQVPMSEMLTYEQHLTSATGGRGSYHMEYSHYDEVPAQQQAKIIAAAKAERGLAVEEV
ncbi:MAG: elongation factor G, partial [Vicinamibacterales bacterium]